MENKNDKKILELKKLVTKKRDELEGLKTGKITYRTNLSLKLFNDSYNLHVLKSEELELLLVRLGLLEREAKVRKIDLVIAGKPVGDWIYDIESKIKQNNIKLKEIQLNELETQLDKKLSEDTRTKIEIDDIERNLSGLTI